MHYHEFDPAPTLAAHASSYWGMTVGQHVARGYPHRIVPDGCVSLVCTHRATGEIGAALVGPRLRELTVPVFPGDRFWGIKFWPDAGGLVLGRAAPDLRDQVIAGPDADAFALDRLSRDAARCAGSAEAALVFDAWLAPRVAPAPALDPAVRGAVVALIASNGEVPLTDVAAGVGLSLRQLQRRFGPAVGLTPKQFARIRRLRAALVELLEPRPRTWSAVAADLGYADQAHFTREVRALAGLAPEALAERIRFIAHGKVRV